ncbi:MAG: hypothetical protein HC842_04105 [Cytophagales bacterium]|nr:hypothetical protein [Cytophagales bacterium]
MAGGLFFRIKNWISKESVKASDLNAEFNNIIDNLKPDKFDDYSLDVTQMQEVANPGATGSESLPTTLAGEIQRLRFAIKG